MDWFYYFIIIFTTFSSDHTLRLGSNSLVCPNTIHISIAEHKHPNSYFNKKDMKNNSDLLVMMLWCLYLINTKRPHCKLYNVKSYFMRLHADVTKLQQSQSFDLIPMFGSITYSNLHIEHKNKPSLWSKGKWNVVLELFLMFPFRSDLRVSNNIRFSS